MDLNTLFPNGIAHYLVGGLLIGLGVSLLYALTGLVGGMSTVYSAVWSFFSKLPFFHQDSLVRSRQWRLVFALGLILGAAIWLRLSGSEPVITQIPWWQLAIGGFIAGFGARFGNGCTSGHGICGMASLNLISVLAVIVFLVVAIITAQLFASLGIGV